MISHSMIVHQKKPTPPHIHVVMRRGRLRREKRGENGNIMSNADTTQQTFDESEVLIEKLHEIDSPFIEMLLGQQSRYTSTTSFSSLKRDLVKLQRERHETWSSTSKFDFSRWIHFQASFLPARSVCVTLKSSSFCSTADHYGSIFRTRFIRIIFTKRL